jgi:hypothetical protein
MNAHAVSAPKTTQRPSVIAAVTLAVFAPGDYAHELLSPLVAYRELYRTHLFYVPEALTSSPG